MINFHFVSLFPESFSSYLGESIIARAIKNKIIGVKFYNPRDFVTGKYKKVWPDGNISAQTDDRPYGGGPGMVLRAEPIIKATKKAIGRKNKVKVIILSPSGKQFTNIEAEKLKKYKDIVFVCGRYEGIDARVKKVLKADEYSVGPYVLTGGELGAMIMMDSISRRISGVLNKLDSLEENRVSTSEVYTRPEIFEIGGKKYSVPKVLLTGNHLEIDKWKKGNNK
jgi:tRNA (guanine37-N1)-methyltransferase